MLIPMVLVLVLASLFQAEVLFSRGRITYSTFVKTRHRVQVHVKKINRDVRSINKHIVPVSTVAVQVSKVSHIENLYERAVNDLFVLEKLQMSKCGIKKISPGAFWNVPRLSVLNLQGNSITSIPYGVFNGLNVTKLYLHKNSIELVHKNAFDDMPFLYAIKLNANYIQQWDSDWFKNCPKVTEIYFRRNELDYLPENAFKNILGKHVVDGKEVVDTKLFLSKNFISEIHPNALSGLTELHRLYLDRNNITKLDVKLFAHVKSLSLLFLAKNNIEDLDENLFPAMDSLEILDLTKNKLKCVPYGVVSKVQMIYLEKNKLDCVCLGEIKTKLLLQEVKQHLIVYDRC